MVVPKLTIELVPQSCQFSNLRSNLKKSDWDRIRKECYKRFSYRCSVCSGKGRKHPVEAHEVWSYDEKTLTQTLVDVVALCPDCHRVKHMGFAVLKGFGEEARKHMRKINQWTRKEGDEYERECFSEYKRRSMFHWRLDISWLNNRGISVKGNIDRFP